MNILVTGGAGFLGSHLCEALLNQGHHVICVDNLLTGSTNNIAHLQDNENFRFIDHDIIDPLFLDEDIDQIYNLACPASPRHYQENSVRTIKVNTIGMINMLGLARAHNARILQASTSEIYGDPEVHPQPETYRGNVSTTGPRACYDEGKRLAEALCYDYRRMHGLEVRIIRIFNTYGPKMAENDGRVVSNFILQALRGEQITIYGDGSQTRSFCYVSDNIRGMIALMNSDVNTPVNIGNDTEITIKELAETIQDVVGSDNELVYEELPKDDPTRRKPDLRKARERLDWEPEVSLREGLAQTIEYFRSLQ